MAYKVYVDADNKLRLTSGKLEGARLLGNFITEFRAIKYMETKGERVNTPWGSIEYHYKGKADGD